MNAKEILSRRFEKATFNGYKTDDVDEFLREISNEFAQLQKEKNELERKLDVLADKIREYRDDEDALKDALLLAQKQGNQIIADSKAQAEQLTHETEEAVAKMLAEATERSQKMIADADEYAKRMTLDSNERADKLVKEARAKAAEIHDMMQRQTEIQQTILQRTRKEAADYRARLIKAYQAHIEFIDQLPEKCENDFVRAASEEVEKREAQRKTQAAMPAPVEEKPVEEAAETPVEAPAEEKTVTVPAEEPAKEYTSELPPAQPDLPLESNRRTADDIPNSPFFSPERKKHKGDGFGK
ncbi:MAG: DivIVA domain-containing protein [Oscillospiraceae bacterium]